jgi:multiple sugar transport system ATP-binding protein
MARVLIDHITKRYGTHGDVLAVNDLNLECRDEEFLALIGPSGCGKSSTLRMIAGLEKISQGEIYIGDSPVSKINPKNLNIAMVFENYALYPHLNVYENMALNLKVKKVSKAEINRKIKEVSRILEIEDILNMGVKQLSGGQKQRVAIGRAIVRSPAAFCIDEPLSHVDVRIRINVRSELRKLFKNIHATVVYVTHNQEDAVALADKIAVMNFGELQQVGNATELYRNPKNIFVAGFIGQPAINLIEGTLRDEKGKLFFAFNNSKTNIPDKYRQNILEKGHGEAVLGIRPLDVALANSEVSSDGDMMAGDILLVELQGDYTLISVRVNDTTVRAQVLGYFKGKPGERIDLGFNQSKIHLFDKKTGLSLL